MWLLIGENASNNGLSLHPLSHFCRLLITCRDLLIFEEKLPSRKSIRTGLQSQPRLSRLELGPTGVTCRFAHVPNLQKHQPVRKYWLNFEPKRVSYWPPQPQQV